MSRSTVKSKEIVSVGPGQTFGIKLYRTVLNVNENGVQNDDLLLLN